MTVHDPQNNPQPGTEPSHTPGPEIPEPKQGGFEIKLPSTDPQVQHEIEPPERGPVVPTPPRPDLDPPKQDPGVPSPGRPDPDAPR